MVADIIAAELEAARPILLALSLVADPKVTGLAIIISNRLAESVIHRSVVVAFLPKRQLVEFVKDFQVELFVALVCLHLVCGLAHEPFQ
jgi:hypothetical protein